MSKVLNSILETIGETPLVRMHRVGSDLPCNLYAKCEYFNPGGSVKDRIAFRMIDEAEKSGRIRPGDTLIEPTSGNTGIGMALAGAVKGYRVIITMPEKMSHEKQVVLEALGATIIRTPTEAAWDAPESHIGVALRMEKELPNAHILDQYKNPANPQAHYETTGQEIYDALDGKVDMVVIGAGTGGTITGVARKLKELVPKCIVVGADPVGSILAGPSEVRSYKVEGIGYDFIPDVLDRDLVDTWVKTTDSSSFLLARRLIHEEGFLCGGSSGAAMDAALKEAKKLPAGANCVVILPDSIRNYLTKFVDQKWMDSNRFVSGISAEGTVARYIERFKEPVESIDIKTRLNEAVELMRVRGFSQLPVTKDGQLAGVLNEKDLLGLLTTGTGVSPNAEVGKILSGNFISVSRETPLIAVQEVMTSDNYAVVVDEDRRPLRVITRIDLLEWLLAQV